MACPSCSFARTFVRRTAVPSLRTQRTFATTPASLQEADAPATPTQQSTNAPLLHITKSKAGYRPSNPNARPPPPSHEGIIRRLGVRFARPVPGAQEWRTSTYSYNKAAIKTLPTAAKTANDLLTYYGALKRTDGVPSSKSELTARRKSAEKVYMSKVGVKDYGDRIRIDAYMFDEQKAKFAAMKKSKEQKAKAGANKTGANKTGGRSRAPRGRAPHPQ